MYILYNLSLYLFHDTIIDSIFHYKLALTSLQLNYKNIRHVVLNNNINNSDHFISFLNNSINNKVLECICFETFSCLNMYLLFNYILIYPNLYY